jgi:hypothetical protein
MIEVTPPHPSSDDHIVFEFTVASNGCCAPSTHDIDSHFYFELVPVDPPLPVLGTYIPVDMQWPVGRLEAGDYQVTVSSYFGEPTTQAFSVSEGVLPFPVPTIPTIGVAGAIVLAIGIAWIANKMFKKKRQTSTA